MVWYLWKPSGWSIYRMICNFIVSVKQLAAVSSTGCRPTRSWKLSVCLFLSLFTYFSRSLSRSILLPVFQPTLMNLKKATFQWMEVLWLGLPSEGLGVIWPAQLLFKDFSFLFFVFRVIADIGYGQIRNNYCQKCIQWCLISLIVHCQSPKQQTRGIFVSDEHSVYVAQHMQQLQWICML